MTDFLVLFRSAQYMVKVHKVINHHDCVKELKVWGYFSQDIFIAGTWKLTWVS